MPSNAELTETIERAAAAVESAVAAWPSPIVLIDGRSGSGKSTLARIVSDRLGAQLLALDSVYPGWDGLAAGAETVQRDVLVPVSEGRTGQWKRWDWQREATAESHLVLPDRALVVEGVGILTAGAASRAQASVWLDSPDVSRRERALLRDGDTYRPHWERWAAQELEHIRLHRPREHASLVFDIP